jgi:ParB-like chromosome segregation protein Spo0J
LKGLSKRVRKSDKEQVERVVRSIRDVGQAAPVLVNGSGVIINGHVVVQALKERGQTNV